MTYLIFFIVQVISGSKDNTFYAIHTILYNSLFLKNE